MPYGSVGAPTAFTIGVLRYMQETGLSHEQLAEVAVVQREWSSLNPRAMMRDRITVATYSPPGRSRIRSTCSSAAW